MDAQIYRPGALDLLGLSSFDDTSWEGAREIISGNGLRLPSIGFQGRTWRGRPAFTSRKRGIKVLREANMAGHESHPFSNS